MHIINQRSCMVFTVPLHSSSELVYDAGEHNGFEEMCHYVIIGTSEECRHSGYISEDH